jgi:hypothetical protein
MLLKKIDRIQSITDKNAKRILINQPIFSILILAGIGLLSYWQYYVPAIYTDDWTSFIGRLIKGYLPWVDWYSTRPLEALPRTLLYYLFGININAYYIVLFSLNLLAAVIFYILLLRLFPENRLYSLITAAIFLVYPTDYTHMWLTMIHIRTAVCLTLLYAILILDFSISGKWYLLILSSVLLILSLGFYEAQLGIALTWVFMLLLFIKFQGFYKVFGLIIQFLIGGFFTIWRTLGIRAMGINDHYGSKVNLNLHSLLDSFFSGFKIDLIWGWTTTIQYYSPWHLSNKSAFLLLVALIIIIYITGFLIVPLVKRSHEQLFRISSKKDNVKPFVISMIIGLVLIPAGYIPITFIVIPNLSGLASRVNIFASLGSAIFLTSIIMIGSLFFSKNKNRLNYLFLASMTPFIILGALTQISVQYATNIAWNEQKMIWKDLVKIVPDFKDNTLVLFILPGYNERIGFTNWQRTPLSSPWGASSALELLYNNPTLTAEVTLPDLTGDNEPILTPQGVMDKFTGILTPYSRTVSFIYNRSEGRLSQINELPIEYINGAVKPVQLDITRVLFDRKFNPSTPILEENLLR